MFLTEKQLKQAQSDQECRFLCLRVIGRNQVSEAGLPGT